MSTLHIDVPASRDMAARLRSVVTAVEDARRGVTSAARLAGLTSEHDAVVALLDELCDEVGGTGQVLGLAADRAEAADTTYAAMLGSWLASHVDALRNSLNDTRGASVLSLIAGSGASTPPAFFMALTPAAAATWLASLRADARLAVAADADRFAGSAVGGAIRNWMATLDGEALREIYVARALLHAGIDIDRWDPTLGLAPNAATVEAVYEYYAELYRSDPDRLWWSGMAALIGPSFYGGFQDIETFRSLLDLADQVAASPLSIALPPGVAIGASQLDDASAELLWYQARLLSMQREIFVDMAAAHEAYLDGGVSAIERFYVDDPHGFGDASVDAWRQIDTGWRTNDLDLVEAGNATLLLREQQFVIADDYDRMHDRPGTGAAMTWLMTLVGAPSVPGARSYPEVFPLSVGASASVGTPERVPLVPILGPWSPSVPVPHIEVEVGAEIVTPLPDGNIADFDDRWALIRDDTLPTYAELARHRPHVVLDELATPIGERAEAFTIQHRIDDILVALATDWSLDPQLDLAAGW